MKFLFFRRNTYERYLEEQNEQLQEKLKHLEDKKGFSLPPSWSQIGNMCYAYGCQPVYTFAYIEPDRSKPNSIGPWVVTVKSGTSFTLSLSQPTQEDAIAFVEKKYKEALEEYTYSRL